MRNTYHEPLPPPAPSLGRLSWLPLFPEDPIPPELKLTDLEQQLIALVQIFMKIKKLPKHMMNAIFDTVINVPMELEDIERTVESLPRAVEDAEIVAVKLKRKMELNIYKLC